jgi:pyruvate-ferredoxin/flavodoxin oxidoreductase
MAMKRRPIAGELMGTVFHVAAGTVAPRALPILYDHSDVMAARSTDWGMLFANSVQEVTDFARDPTGGLFREVLT